MGLKKRERDGKCKRVSGIVEEGGNMEVRIYRGGR
jgi:hypothetical protein